MQCFHLMCFTCIHSFQQILHSHHHFPRRMEIHLNTQTNTTHTSRHTSAAYETKRGRQIACNVLPRTQRARWPSCSAQRGRTHRRWPQPAAPRLSSSAAPLAHDPHRCAHRNWPSTPGTWWACAEPGSYLVLEIGRKEEGLDKDFFFFTESTSVKSKSGASYQFLTSCQGLLHLDCTERRVDEWRHHA